MPQCRLHVLEEEEEEKEAGNGHQPCNKAGRISTLLRKRWQISGNRQGKDDRQDDESSQSRSTKIKVMYQGEALHQPRIAPIVRKKHIKPIDLL
mmetsp:Transcript_86652/g.181564  ORF Transcript_86652/g.181564 Transcript_86652/m.181564 type:complete len:94 (+) Transcript_86652:180-461(+)